MFLRGFSLASCPQHSLKVPLALYATCLLKYVLNCEEDSSFVIFRSELSDFRINCDRTSDGLLCSI
jgi:hypothetical protein